MTARQIIDAIDPKRTLRQVRHSFDLAKFLEHHGFTAVRPGDVYRKEGRIAKIRIVRQRDYEPGQEPVPAWWVRVFALRPGMWELIYERTLRKEEEVIAAIQPYLPSLREALDPKRFLRKMELGRGSKLRQALLKDHWKEFGTGGLSWQKEFLGHSWDDPPRRYFVWWDNEAREWVIKGERKKRVANNWSNWKDAGFSVYRDEAGALQHLVNLGLVWLSEMKSERGMLTSTSTFTQRCRCFNGAAPARLWIRKRF